MQNKYGIIYADPAWTFVTYSKKGKGKSPEQHYNCMTFDELCGLPVNDWSDDDCALFMWTIDTHLPQALKLMEAWGFEYKTTAFVWAKTTKRGKWHFGTGYWTRANPEICLLGTKGKPQRVARNVRKLVVDEVREHSRKPDRIRDDIVNLCGDVPRLEMFARTKTPGWDVWGNETDKFK